MQKQNKERKGRKTRLKTSKKNPKIMRNCKSGEDFTTRSSQITVDLQLFSLNILEEKVLGEVMLHVTAFSHHNKGRPRIMLAPI